MNADALMRARMDAYVAFFETLSPETLPHLVDLAAPDVRFRDPLNDVVGVAAMTAILEAMFHELDEPRFRVSHRAYAGQTLLLRWRFDARTRRGRFGFEGMSTIVFGADGRVAEHLDYWDAGAAIYERVPLIGRMVRLIRRRLGRLRSTPVALPAAA